ncbi:DUF3325 domain-containing protein [Sphingobium cloacae]|uniref:DUF3325 domain-containing protein n=1 Tax=Sphingobium cloacae TaxID=120107 RepID=UPI0008365693|nr:DUF3325 domain-containing protein [Sphingobium cloacae]
MTFLAFLAACAAFASLALSMEKHHQDLLKKRPSRRDRRTFRIAGWAGLALSYGLTVMPWGAATGSILWFGLLSLAAAMILLFLSQRSSRAK